MAFGADAPHRPTHRSCSLSALADGRRKVKNALYCSVFKEQLRQKKCPSLSMPKSKGTDNLKILKFHNFFKFFKNFDLTLMYCDL